MENTHDLLKFGIFGYPNLNFDVKNYFASNIYQLLGPNWSQRKENAQNLLKFDQKLNFDKNI